MSGFDFGSLRDPDAPQPDSHHRDRVEARAHELRAKTRRNRAVLSGLAVVVVVAAVAGIVATRPDRHQVIVTDPSSTIAPTPSSVGDRFAPPTTTESGITTLPVTLPDGATFTMRYPEQMRIAQLGFAGGIGVSGTEVQINYTTISHLYLDSKPLAEYLAANGAPVPVFQGYRPVGVNGPPPADELAFQFGPWLVRVTLEGKTDAQRAIWARSLTGTTDANGYLLLHAAAPLSLGSGFDGGFGSQTGNFVELAWRLYCGQPESDTNVRRRFVNNGDPGVSWCAGDLHVSATGTKTFVNLAADQLQVIGAPTSHPPSPTTTTTTPPVSPANAVSASFVSVDHGWLLESNGDVAATTDAGATWHAVGSLGRPVSSMKIRFADANRGFAVPLDLADQATTLTTDDGGATWTALALPFSGRAYDLAISNGTVYAVAFDNGKFRIWSSPADNLSWTEDPITIPVGGGPVPTIQLVFSNGAGWLIEVDRVVVGGAQISTSGNWSKWTPPCSTANGPASLAGWSATDLIASCDEGVWGSPPAPAKAVYTSHDAGATFQRHRAPVFGAVAAADPNYALLATGDTIRRSVDGGRTWTTVVGSAMSNPGGSQPLDLGFTSNMQGFVIFANHQMVMTYDAGATWSAVTRP